MITIPFRRSTDVLCALPVAALALLGSAQATLAHVTFEVSSATLGANAKAVLRVPHGCSGAATTAIRVEIPDGIVGVKPMPKAGWTLDVETGAYAKPHMISTREVSEGVRAIVWRGGSLPDSQYDEFAFQMHPAKSLGQVQAVAFPVVQTCTTGQNRWVETAAPGQDAHGLKSPAPLLKLVQAPQGGGHGGHTTHSHDAPKAPAATGKTYTLKDLVIETPWSRETPTGARVAGGFFKITNKGTTADRLVGGSVPFAGRMEVHEMAVVDGVMRMRELDKGLEIQPGQTVELKPGSFHVMFMELKDGLKAGQSVKGTLVFANAGTIEVEYAVEARTEPQKGQPSGHKH